MNSAPAGATESGGIVGQPGVSPAPALHLLDAARVLNRAGGALWAQARLHGQLVRIEWEEEKVRLLKMLAVILLGFACLLSAMLFAGGLLLAAAWDTAYRLYALAGLALLYGSGAVVAWRRFQALSVLSGNSFAASRAELAADAAVLEQRS